ncbi:MAG: glycosyltransferase [Parvibaculum sp.]|nr:glycosyltransferase [Parvibaculum sp.]
MRIDIVLPDLRAGGVERVRTVLAREFVRHGHSVIFLLMQAQGELLAETRSEFPVVDLKCRRTRDLIPALVRHLRSERPDAVLAALWPLTSAVAIARSISRHRCRLVVSEHNTLSVQYRNWGAAHRIGLCASLAIGHRLADARVGVSMGVVNDLSRLSGISRSKYEVIYNPTRPFAMPTHQALDEVETLWNVPRGGRIVTVGSLKPQKNHALLLNAFSRLHRPDLRLMLVGAGALEGELKDLARRLGIEDRVIFAGFRSNPTPFYCSADLFVLSSDHEGMPNVLNEALACGMKVVSTDCPSGPAEMLKDGQYGTLVPVGDVEALAIAMNEKLQAVDDLASLRTQADILTPEQSARAYLNLLVPL